MLIIKRYLLQLVTVMHKEESITHAMKMENVIAKSALQAQNVTLVQFFMMDFQIVKKVPKERLDLMVKCLQGIQIHQFVGMLSIQGAFQ